MREAIIDGLRRNLLQRLRAARLDFTTQAIMKCKFERLREEQ